MLKFAVTWSVKLIHCSVVLYRARKPKWLALSRSITSMWLWTIFRIFLKSLPEVGNRLIGSKFCGNVGSLQSFAKITIFASFLTKMRQPKAMTTSIKYTRGLLGWYLGHSFGISSIPRVQWRNEILCITASYFSKGVSSAASSSAWTLASICQLRHPSHVHAVWTDFLNNPQSYWLSLAVHIWSLKGYRYLLVPLVHSPSICSRAWDETPQFAIFVSHRSSVFLWDIFWWFSILNWLPSYMLDTGFLSTVFVVAACFNERSSSWRSWLFKAQSVILLIDSLYAETTKAAVAEVCVYIYVAAPV
jgi:hypothetical protein